MRLQRLTPPRAAELDPLGRDPVHEAKRRRKMKSHNRRVIEQRKQAAEVIAAWLQVWAK